MNLEPETGTGTPDTRTRSSGLQKTLMVLGIVAIIASIAIAAAMYFTRGLTEAADRFFVAGKTGDMVTARSLLAEDFRALTPDTELERFFESSALRDYASASWSTRQVRNSLGRLEGVVKTTSGGSVPMTVAFVRENGEWRILSIRKAEAGLLEADTAGIPSRDEIVRLASATTAAFSQSLQQKDFTPLYDQMAIGWRGETSPEALAASFQSFADLSANWAALQQMTPEIRDASIGEQGELIVEGAYPAGAKELWFRQTYLYEGLDWQLAGLNVRID